MKTFRFTPQLARHRDVVFTGELVARCHTERDGLPYVASLYRTHQCREPYVGHIALNGMEQYYDIIKCREDDSDVMAEFFGDEAAFTLCKAANMPGYRYLGEPKSTQDCLS